MRRYPDVCKLGWNFKSYVSLCVNKYCNGAENNTYTCFGEICSCCCCLPLLPHLACNNLATMILQLFSLKLRVDLAVCLVCLVRFLARILSLPPSTWCDVWDSYSSPYRRGRGLRGLSCQNIPGVRYLFIVHILHMSTLVQKCFSVGTTPYHKFTDQKKCLSSKPREMGEKKSRRTGMSFDQNCSQKTRRDFGIWDNALFGFK